LIEVYFTRRQTQARATLRGNGAVLLPELGIAVGAGGDHHEVDALLEDLLAPVAHRLLARRLDDDVRLELEQRLQGFDDGDLAADLLLGGLRAALAHQHAHDVDRGLLLLEYVEQHLADGAIADQRDFQPLFLRHFSPPNSPNRRDYSGWPRALRPLGGTAITAPRQTAGATLAFLTECSSAW
jgi:hypothetical protein